MGDIADMELDSVIDMEGYRDDYVQGLISDEKSHDMGFLNELGIEQDGIQDAWDRSKIGTLDELNNMIEVEMLHLDVCTYRKAKSYHRRGKLNNKAIVNLLKEYPTCNVCENEMTERHGVYGVFYFCSCEEQKTVSQSYWDKVRIK